MTRVNQARTFYRRIVTQPTLRKEILTLQPALFRPDRFQAHSWIGKCWRQHSHNPSVKENFVGSPLPEIRSAGLEETFGIFSPHTRAVHKTSSSSCSSLSGLDFANT